VPPQNSTAAERDVGNKFYQEGEERRARVDDLFSKVAPRYDLINDLQSFWMHRAWKRRLIRMARVKDSDRGLDLCCGTGDIAFALARQGALVAGVDFSAAMLSVAQSRAESAPSRPAFQRADAQQLPFDDNTFDVVTVGYGLRNLPSWERGLEEMWRVTRPGGRLLVLDFGKPDNPLLRRTYFAYLRLAVPLFGKLFCGDAATHAYILESLLHYPAQRGVAEKMRRLGCTDVRIENLIGGAMSINSGIKRA
jgi:demethylmenaquinone methyltransferase / 2-methoxy-6-polyprenyl-1,4-benzoquinol methylase